MAISWVTLTEADLLAQVGAAQLDNWRKLDLAAGQADPVAPLLDRTIAEVRGFVAKVATLNDDTATIPAGLVGVAIDIVVERLARRMPAKVDEDIARAATQARTRLASLSGREFDSTQTGSWGSKERLNLPPNDTETTG